MIRVLTEQQVAHAAPLTRPALNLRSVSELGESTEPSPDKGPPAGGGGHGMYPSPTPNIIDSLMGEVVFETFTPRCARAARHAQS